MCVCAGLLRAGSVSSGPATPFPARDSFPFETKSAAATEMRRGRAEREGIGCLQKGGGAQLHRQRKNREMMVIGGERCNSQHSSDRLWCRCKVFLIDRELDVPCHNTPKDNTCASQPHVAVVGSLTQPCLDMLSSGLLGSGTLYRLPPISLALDVLVCKCVCMHTHTQYHIFCGPKRISFHSDISL